MEASICYTGQIRDLRKFLADKVDDISLKTDGELERCVLDDGFIVLAADSESLLLIKEDEVKRLVDSGDAVWLER